jgi:flagellar hook-basal body complex protein FliE
MSNIGGVSGRPDINQLLNNMKAMRSQIQPPVKGPDQLVPSPVDQVNKTEPTQSFGSLFTSAINSVNETQQASGALSKAYAEGDPSVDITRVMIQSQKSAVAFQAMLQVRNKMVQAYEDVMKMPV